MKLAKPSSLKPGDTVAVVSPSWGGPGALPHRYLAGKKVLEQDFGLHVIEMPHTCTPADLVAKNPQARADDIMSAFSDPNIKGIIASIGGDDSVRLLPYLDLNVIRENPKIFMGYSDTTTLHFACLSAGLSSFYGPSVMAGFAESGGMHVYTKEWVRRALFTSEPLGLISPASEWTVEHLDWSPENQSKKRQMVSNSGMRFINGTGVVRGHLMGGCIEVLEMIKGTSIWPALDVWRGAIVFLETSEEAPSLNYVRRWLRHYGSLGILQVINGIIFGRPGGAKLSDADRLAYDDVLVSVIRDELGLECLPILANVDFGHTDPMCVIPYGAMAEIDTSQSSLTIL